MPRFVFRPAVKFGASETLGLALIAIGTPGCTPTVVRIDLGVQITVSETLSSCTVVSNDRRGVIPPSSAGQPRHMPATGMTFSGNANISLTIAAWSRITLMGQQPDRQPPQPAETLS